MHTPDTDYMTLNHVDIDSADGTGTPAG
jgi:hypothetical protein